jgi:RNA polymerase sigma-70 factor (ECF subfamily)
MPVPLRARQPSQAGSSPGTDAFSCLYEAFVDPIYWYCRARLGDCAAAEDAVSTVFTRALAAGPRYDDPSLRSWLFGIAHNVLANWYRAARTTAPIDAALHVVDNRPLPEETVVADEERDRLLSALRLLPEDQRRVVELRMVGLTGPEIARLLGRNPGAVRMLQLRAFTRLRELLAEDEDDHHG